MFFYIRITQFFCHCIGTSGVCDINPVLSGIHAFNSAVVIEGMQIPILLSKRQKIFPEKF